MKKRTCEQLGVCQGLGHCGVCACEPRHPFAPGVIDGPQRNGKDTVVMGVVWAVVYIGAVCAVVGFAAGYISLPGVLLP